MPDIIGAVPDLPELEPRSEEYFLDLFNRILPAHYINPLWEPGPGHEMLEAFAAIGARVSDAVTHIANGNYIATAQGGSYAEGEVEFYRDTFIWGAFTLQAGTVVGTVDGYQFTTLAPVTFGATDLGPHTVTVRATVRSWMYNFRGPVTLDDSTVLPGDINRLVRPVLTNAQPNFDPTVKLRQKTATVGGASPMLDGLGYDRGVERGDGESDDSYRLRIALLPLTVTPNAIERLVDQIVGDTLRQLGLPFWVYEGWDLRVQTCWDAPVNEVWSTAEQNAQVPPYNANVFVWDYAPTTTSAYQPGAWTNRVLEGPNYRSSIIIGLPNVPSLYGLFAGLAQNIQQAKPAGVPVYYVVA